MCNTIVMLPAQFFQPYSEMYNSFDFLLAYTPQNEPIISYLKDCSFLNTLFWFVLKLIKSKPSHTRMTNVNALFQAI